MLVAMFARPRNAFFSSSALASPANRRKECKRHQKIKGKSACVRNKCQMVLGSNHNSIMVLRATPKEVAVWSSLQAMSFDDSKEYPTWLFFCYPVAIKRGNKVYKIIIIKLAKHCRCLRTRTYINKCYDHSRYVWCI